MVTPYIDPNGSDYDAINAEKTQRWAAEKNKVVGPRGPENGYQGSAVSPIQQTTPATNPLDQMTNAVSAGIKSAFAPPPPVETTFQQDIDSRSARMGAMQSALTPGYKQARFGLPSYENGGKPESAEDLLARMSAKYGKAPSIDATAPAPQPQPKPTPQPKPAGSLIQKAANLFSNRTKQIDQAAGYSRGGKPGAQGFKITGPGTATSDSIPAQTEAGENIRVANGERVVSVAQDEALERIAEMLGYASVDAMFAEMTGKPVGPTIKGGKLAAAQGYKDEAGNYHPMSVLGAPASQGNGDLIRSAAATESVPPAPVTGTPRAQKDFSGEFLGGLKNYMAAKTPVATEEEAAQLRAADDPFILGAGRIGPNLIKQVGNIALHKAPDVPGSQAMPATPPAQPATAPATVAPTPTPGASIQAVAPADLTGRQQEFIENNNLRSFEDRGGGITRQVDGKGRTTITNVGTGDITDSGKRAADDSASALLDQKGSTYNPTAQLERMQRSRMMADATNADITDPTVRENAQKALGTMSVSKQTENQATLQAAQARTANAQADTAAETQAMHKEYLNPKTTPERRKEIHDYLRAMSGKTAGYKVATTSSPNPNGIGPNLQQAWLLNEDTGEVRNAEKTAQEQTQAPRRVPTAAEIDATAKKYGMTPEQVKQKLGLK